jgi:phage gpG-like protein
MQLNVSISDGITPRMKKMMAKTVNMRPAMESGGMAIVSMSVRAFSSPAMRPAPWAALKPLTLKSRKSAGFHGSSILRASGALSHSPRVISATANSVTVGSDRRVGSYSLAAIHQFGAPRRKIPARPFFPITGTLENPGLTERAKAKFRTAIIRYIASSG